jgi:hypothetical protein
VAAAQAVAERQRSQSLLHLRSDAYELMAVPQENLQIALLAGRYANRGKAILREQHKDQARIAAVVFLFANSRTSSPV